jgi:tetratricopeptide (TPR) repeat protein
MTNEVPIQDIEELEQSKTTANLLFKNGDFRSASRHYEDIICRLESLGLTPTLTILMTACANNAAAAYLELGQNREAIAATSKVLNVDPKNLKALYRRSLGYKREGSYDKAMEDLQVLISVEPSNIQATTLAAELSELQANSEDPLSSNGDDRVTHIYPAEEEGDKASETDMISKMLPGGTAPVEDQYSTSCDVADSSNFVRPDWIPEYQQQSQLQKSPEATRGTQDSISRILQLQTAFVKVKSSSKSKDTSIEALMKRVKISTTPKAVGQCSTDAEATSEKFRTPVNFAVDQALSELNDLEVNAKEKVIHTLAVKDQYAKKSESHLKSYHRFAFKGGHNKDFGSIVEKETDTTRSHSPSPSNSTSHSTSTSTSVSVEKKQTTQESVFSKPAASAWEDLMQDESKNMSRYQSVVVGKQELAKQAAKRKRKVAANTSK